MVSRALMFFAALALVQSAPAAGQVCAGRPIEAADGTASGVDDCELTAWIDRADLRPHLAPCVEAMRAAERQVFGRLHLQVILAPGGGLLRVQAQTSAFDKTGLPACAVGVIRRRLNRPSGPAEGKPAPVDLVLGVDEKSFSLDLAARLLPEDPVDAEPERLRSALPGGFRRSLSGSISSCPLGKGSLVLRLEPLGQGASSWVVPVTDESLRKLVEDCLSPFPSDLKNGRGQRKQRRRESQCLIGLLEHGDARVRAMAADAIHDAMHWRARRALDKTARKMVGMENCRPGSCADDCVARSPEGYWPGLALVRILRAQQRLNRRIRDEVLSAILRHDLASVRLRLVRDVVRVWRGGLPDLLAPLYQDPDPQVRVHACQRACLEGSWPARRAFVELLGSDEPHLRAMALLHARACAQREPEALRSALAKEGEPVLAAMMRRLLPGWDEELSREAQAGLLHACPVVRHLSARWLARLPELPRPLVEAALARERDPLLQEGLRRLLAGQAAAQPREQLWWQESTR